MADNMFSAFQDNPGLLNWLGNNWGPGWQARREQQNRMGGVTPGMGLPGMAGVDPSTWQAGQSADQRSYNGSTMGGAQGKPLAAANNPMMSQPLPPGPFVGGPPQPEPSSWLANPLNKLRTSMINAFPNLRGGSEYAYGKPKPGMLSSMMPGDGSAQASTLSPPTSPAPTVHVGGEPVDFKGNQDSDGGSRMGPWDAPIRHRYTDAPGSSSKPDFSTTYESTKDNGAGAIHKVKHVVNSPKDKAIDKPQEPEQQQTTKGDDIAHKAITSAGAGAIPDSGLLGRISQIGKNVNYPLLTMGLSMIGQPSLGIGSKMVQGLQAGSSLQKNQLAIQALSANKDMLKAQHPDWSDAQLTSIALSPEMSKYQSPPSLATAINPQTNLPSTIQYDQGQGTATLVDPNRLSATPTMTSPDKAGVGATGHLNGRIVTKAADGHWYFNDTKQRAD